MKAAGLLPPPVGPTVTRLETSVYRVDGLTAGAVWELAAEYVDAVEQPMTARGSAAAKVFFDARLNFDADGTPHERHANVVEWPEEKHLQKDIARQIADVMTLELRAAASDRPRD